MSKLKENGRGKAEEERVLRIKNCVSKQSSFVVVLKVTV